MIQPDYSAALGLLSHLDCDELKEMLNDDNKFDAVLKDMKQIKDWETEKEIIIASNRSLAEFNLSREPMLKEAKTKIQELSETGEELCDRIRVKLEEYKSKSAGVSPDTTLALLQTLAAQSEETSENTAQNFLSGEMEIEKFLEDFTEERQKMHIRKFKADKMNELLRSPQQFNLFGNGMPSQNPTQSYPPFPSQPNYYPRPVSGPAPYPISGMHIPMPGVYGNPY